MGGRLKSQQQRLKVSLRTLALQSAKADFGLLLQRFQPPEPLGGMRPTCRIPRLDNMNSFTAPTAPETRQRQHPVPKGRQVKAQSLQGWERGRSQPSQSRRDDRSKPGGEDLSNPHALGPVAGARISGRAQDVRQSFARGGASRWGATAKCTEDRSLLRNDREIPEALPEGFAYGDVLCGVRCT